MKSNISDSDLIFNKLVVCFCFCRFDVFPISFVFVVVVDRAMSKRISDGNRFHSSTENTEKTLLQCRFIKAQKSKSKQNLKTF